MRRWFILVLVVLIAAAVVERDRIAPYLPPALAAYLPSQGGEQDGSGGKGGGRGRSQGGTATVTVATAADGSLPILRDSIGWVRPVASTVLTSETAGTIAEIAVGDGASIKAGDLVARLDDRAAKALVTKDEAAVARDQATLDAANDSLARIERLVASGAATSQAGDDARTAVRSATATVAVDRAALAADHVAFDKTQIRAPFDGRLGVVSPSLGTLVTPGTAIATLTQVSPVLAEFSLPENDLDLLQASLQAGTLQATIDPPGESTPARTGPVVFIDNAVDQASGTIRLRARLPNDDGALVPGQSIAVRAQAGLQGGLVVVPGVAVEPREDGSAVYVVGADATVEVRPVTVALRVGDQAGLSAGLKAGERVVTEGQGGLRAGSRVEVKEAAPQPAEGGPVAATDKPAEDKS
ncbi:efflux RND transporter periplasmic adaptor subunit [Aureimonas sp. AU4]|uniref:efflux RND transporter periplasmic adaptor subunit n=1 Tax=Aureimonas sp. AU4 TaxID=1638163 RepID=UPI0009E6C91F|nr:efflux RND transporter periplasmic adaptor subunit [Aureimonas sp. AU4]